ncbi:MAG: hypothetical protein ACRCYY_10155 [Trueperaceae bacterium]
MNPYIFLVGAIVSTLVSAFVVTSLVTMRSDSGTRDNPLVQSNNSVSS